MSKSEDVVWTKELCTCGGVGAGDCLCPHKQFAPRNWTLKLPEVDFYIEDHSWGTEVVIKVKIKTTPIT